MAFFDWNNDGKNNYIDDFIEYNIVMNSIREKEESTYRFGKGKKCLIAGFFLQAALYGILGIDVDNVPAVVIIILWVLFSVIVSAVIDKMR